MAGEVARAAAAEHEPRQRAGEVGRGAQALAQVAPRVGLVRAGTRRASSRRAIGGRVGQRRRQALAPGGARRPA